MLDEIDDDRRSACARSCTRTSTRSIETADELERFLDASPVPICLDTGHLTLGGADPVELADAYAERVGLVHLKDVRTVADRLNAGDIGLMAAVQAGLFAPLGDGDVPIAEIITTLERQGYAGLYVLEQDVAITAARPPAGEGPVRDVAKSVAFLRSLDASLSATVRARSHAQGTGFPPLTATEPDTTPRGGTDP